MTKQATPPPTRDKGTPTAPPPPPSWRHYLWIIAFLLFIGLYFVLPATEMKSPVTLNYTQFLGDVSAHKVKTITLNETNGSATGTLAAGGTYTTVIPTQAGRLSWPNCKRTRSRSRPRAPAPRSGPRCCRG